MMSETGSQSQASNNYEDLAAHRGDEGRFREEKISRGEKTSRENRRRRRTLRRDRIEMVGVWNPRGESLSRGEKQAEWRRLSDRAYSPLCFRSQAWPAGERFSFSLVLYTRKHSHFQRTRTHMNVYIDIYPCMRVSLRLLSLSMCRAHRAVRFPPSWPPRGPSLPTFTIQPWEQLHALFVSFFSFFHSLAAALDCYISNVSGNSTT